MSYCSLQNDISKRCQTHRSISKVVALGKVARVTRSRLILAIEVEEALADIILALHFLRCEACVDETEEASLVYLINLLDSCLA